MQWGVTAVTTYDPVGRPLRTDFPDGTVTRSEYAVWKVEVWDQNDTVLDTDNVWYAARVSTATPTPSAAEQRARSLSEAHAGTSTRTFQDTMGRPFLGVAHNKDGTSDLFYETRTALDIQGNPLSVVDPLGRTCQSHAFSMGGRLLAESNIDRGDRWAFQDVAGAPLRRWDLRDQVFRWEYDALRRPTHLWLKVGSAAEVLLERRYYGDDAGVTSPEVDNLKGQLVALYDQAGLAELGPFDFKGNLLESARTLATQYSGTVDWSAIGTTASAASAKTTVTSSLESETFSETRAFDALNRVTSVTAPDNSEFIPSYNEASLLEAVDVKLRGASTATSFVNNVDYNEKGQHTKIEYGNGTESEITHDPLTFRMTRLLTTRASDSKKLQDLSYTYDPSGNVVAIADAAHDDVYFDNAVVSASQLFEYDALCRLVAASGREHKSIADVQVGVDGAPLQTLPHNNDSTAVRNYNETYDYDAVGNILEMFHEGISSPSATWMRTYSYGSGTPTNRLVSNTVPGGTASYTHDDHGNITSMSHLASIGYSPFDQMATADLGSGGDAYYTYDAGGQRVRKLVDTGANLIKERIYLGGFEIYRERTSGGVQLERETLHIMDGVKRVAMVETKSIDGGSAVGTPTLLQRFEYSNHLGSATLECDDAGLVISYEELHPYGSSAYRSAKSGTEVSARRYRYTGKERDEETGLDYFGARHYAPWLGRWTSADPLGLQAGLNLYLYGRASPVVMVDPDGMQEVTASRPAPPAPKPLGQRGVGTDSQGHQIVEIDETQIVASKPRIGWTPEQQASPAYLAEQKRTSETNAIEKGAWQAARAKEDSLLGYAAGVAMVLLPVNAIEFLQEPSSLKLGRILDAGAGVLPKPPSERASRGKTAEIREAVEGKATAFALGQQTAALWGAALTAATFAKFGVETAPGSPELDWSVVSKTGETRSAHIAKHGTNDFQKPSHGVFYGDAAATVSDAWAKAMRTGLEPTPVGGADIYVVPRPNSGFSGGYTGQGRNLNTVTIITLKGTNRLITGFPGNGLPTPKP